MVEAYICLRGNFYAYKQGVEGRPIQQIIPLKAGSVQKVEQNEDMTLTYFVQFKNGEIRPVPQTKILHFRGLTLDGITGVNPIEYARETIGNGLASNAFLGNFFSKGMHPGAIFKHPLPLNAPAHANKKAELKKKYEGLGKAWEMMLVDEGMSVEFPTVKLVDAQFLEQMRMNEAQICGLYRVPLMLIQSGDKAPTYASSEQFMIAYSVYGVTPDIVNYEKSAKRDLMTPEEKKKYYIKFSLQGLVRGDFRTRMEGYQTGINCEMLSPNECRDLEDLNPYEGGDEYRTRTSTTKESGNQGEKGNESTI
jgi:HK97 family phage portal protein